MANEYKTYNDFKIGEEVLEFLVRGEALTESKARSITARANILTESNDIDNQPLFESSNPVTTIKTDDQEVRVSWDTFYDVYTQPRKYPELFDVFSGLGFDVTRFNTGDRDALMNKLRTGLAHANKRFVDNNDKAHLGTWSTRREGWGPNGHIRKQFEENGYDSETVFDEKSQVPLATKEGVMPGTRNKQTRTVTLFNNLNDDNILPGNLYADFTRIPKSNWNSFIKFWNRRRTSVAADKSLFGKEWKKIFLFGYQVNTNMFFEVWYNSVDSSFSVHDSRGAEMARRSPTMSEVIRKLFNHVLQVSRNDIDFDAADFNRATQLSISRAAAKGMAGDERMMELINRENARSKKKDTADAYKQQEKDTADAYKQQEKGKGFIAKSIDSAKNDVKGQASFVYRKGKEAARNAKEDVKDQAEYVYRKGKEAARNAKDEYKATGFGSTEDEYTNPNFKEVKNGEATVTVNPRSNETPDERIARYSLTMQKRRERDSARKVSGKPTKTDDVIVLGDEGAKERRKSVENALKTYQNQRKAALGDTSLMMNNPPKKDTRGDDVEKEKEVKPAITKTTPKVKAKPKTKAKAKSKTNPRVRKQNPDKPVSLFGDSDTINDDIEDYSGFRKPLSAEEKKQLERDFAYTDDDAYDDDAFAAKMDQISGLNEAFNGMDIGEQSDVADAITNGIADETRDSSYQNKVEALRRDAMAKSFTAGAFKDMISSDIVQLYRETRAPKTGKLRWLERRFLKGRPDIKTLPTDSQTFFSKVKGAIIGGVFRADFVIGYSVSDRVDFEIWYVTEPNPEFNWASFEILKSKTDVPRFISSFYVYDISGQLLIRKYIPYYRNALSVVSNKLFAIT